MTDCFDFVRSRNWIFYLTKCITFILWLTPCYLLTTSLILTPSSVSSYFFEKCHSIYLFFLRSCNWKSYPIFLSNFCNIYFIRRAQTNIDQHYYDESLISRSRLSKTASDEQQKPHEPMFICEVDITTFLKCGASRSDLFPYSFL